MKTLAATALLAAATLALGAPAQAQVVPGDTFSFDLSGYANGATTGLLLTNQLTGIFGQTQTFVGAGPNGQDITITSSQTLGAIDTATFTISTPTSFITTTTFGGTTINELQFDLGNGNSGSDPVNFLTPIASYTATGSLQYNTNSSLALAPVSTLSGDGLSLFAAEIVTAGTQPISAYNVHAFTYTISYTPVVAAAAVPEPAGWALMIGGVGAIGVALRRSRRAARVAAAA